MTQISVQIIFGQNSEPFLEAALRSVEWADYVVAVNTAPDTDEGWRNSRTIHDVVEPDKLRSVDLRMPTFSFAAARNRALEEADYGDYVLIVDADDVHYPEFEEYCRDFVRNGLDVVSAHFWHHCVYKDLWLEVPHREILFRNEQGVHFENTQGNVHEELVCARQTSGMVPDYRYHHYGYIKPAREVSARWEFYRSLGAPIHDYDVSEPDRAFDDWPLNGAGGDGCKLYTGEHPDVVRPVLGRYPSAPTDLWLRTGVYPPRVGLVMLTWDDEENLRRCLRTLEFTTESFDLLVVDNGSTDGTADLIERWASEQSAARWVGATDDGWSGGCHFVHYVSLPGSSLVEALNYGFGDGALHAADYLGWVHPDMAFEWPRWLEYLVEEMDAHPDWAKCGAYEFGNGIEPEAWAGNSQCYLIRRTALEKAGLFDERFQACGGYEDWEHNHRLLKHGKVMITPKAKIRHLGMRTRMRHDNQQAARDNSELYTRLTGRGEAPV